MSEYRIDDLARAAGTTVRNVRVYQDRGLLPPPRREGRAGVYGEPHLARLRLIGQLLERGYTFAHIGEFLAAWQQGRNLSDLLGLEQVLTTPWSNDVDDSLTTEELVELLGAEQITEDNLVELSRQELIVPDGDRYRVPSPRLLRAGYELVRAGLPLRVALELSASLALDMDACVTRLVAAVADQAVIARTASSLDGVGDLVTRLTPLAQRVLDAHLAQAIERQVRQTVHENRPSTAAEPQAAP